MKHKVLMSLLAIVLLFSALNSQAASIDNKAIEAKVAGMTQEQKQARAEEIKARLDEIKNMDKSQLTSEERKELKYEIKSMKKEAKLIGGGGVYISLAGILIIILVLILIL